MRTGWRDRQARLDFITGMRFAIAGWERRSCSLESMEAGWRRIMADQNTPNHAANMEKAEGNRRTPMPGRVPDSESSSGRGYSDDDGDNAGGITNRPLDTETENQEALPERNKSQRDERSRSNRGVER
jgi:hypothetical protein